MPRKAHVKRVWKLDDSGNPIENVWMDVLRIDDLPIEFRGIDTGVQGQIVNFRFHWNDDPGNPDPGTDDSSYPQLEGANPSRKSRKLHIKNPDFPDDDSQTNTLWISDQEKIAMPQGSPLGLSGQFVNLAYNNLNPYSVANADPPYDGNTAGSDRKVTVIKVVNNDLGGLDMKAAAGSGLQSQIIDWDTYKAALATGTKDDSQHLDIEVVDVFKIVFGADAQTGAKGQIINYALGGNQELEPDQPGSSDPPLFDAGNPGAVDSNGNSSVIRIDPLQIIVNVSWKPAESLLVGGYLGDNSKIVFAWMELRDNGSGDRIPTIVDGQIPWIGSQGYFDQLSLWTTGLPPIGHRYTGEAPSPIDFPARSADFLYGGNFAVNSGSLFDKSDNVITVPGVYFDNKHKLLPKPPPPPPPPDPDKIAGTAIFSDGSGTVYVSSDVIAKYKGKSRLWTYAGPLSSDNGDNVRYYAANIDKSGNMVVVGVINDKTFPRDLHVIWDTVELDGGANIGSKDVNLSAVNASNDFAGFQFTYDIAPNGFVAVGFINMVKTWNTDGIEGWTVDYSSETRILYPFGSGTSYETPDYPVSVVRYVGVIGKYVVFRHMTENGAAMVALNAPDPDTGDSGVGIDFHDFIVTYDQAGNKIGDQIAWGSSRIGQTIFTDDEGSPADCNIAGNLFFIKSNTGFK